MGCAKDLRDRIYRAVVDEGTLLVESESYGHHPKTSHSGAEVAWPQGFSKLGEVRVNETTSGTPAKPAYHSLSPVTL